MALLADERKLLVETHANSAVTREMAERHDKTLYGNGKPGLCTTVQRHEDAFTFRSRSHAIVWGLVTAGCGGTVGAILMGAFTYLLKQPC